MEEGRVGITPWLFVHHQLILWMEISKLQDLRGAFYGASNKYIQDDASRVAAETSIKSMLKGKTIAKTNLRMVSGYSQKIISSMKHVTKCYIKGEIHWIEVKRSAIFNKSV